MSMHIPRDRKEITLYTRNHRIVGEVYLVAGKRVTDELNMKNKDYLSVTSAKIFALEGDTLIEQVDMVSVNKSCIDLLISSDESPETQMQP